MATIPELNDAEAQVEIQKVMDETALKANTKSRVASIMNYLNKTVAKGWSLAGNVISSTDYLGSTNNVDLTIIRQAQVYIKLWANNIIEFRGKVGINTSAPEAALDVSSTSEGVLIPRLTQTQINEMESPTVSEIVFNSTKGYHETYNGTKWVAMDPTKIPIPAWSGTEQQYIVVSVAPGNPNNLRPITLNENQIPFWSGNSFLNSNLYIGSFGFIGIGTSTPLATLDVNGNIKTKAVWYSGFTIAQRDAMLSPQEGMLIYVNEGTKGFQKYQDGAWSAMGSNISTDNLTWSADRTQNLGTKKLSFTNGRFSVPTLEMEVTSASSVPNKIWTAGSYLWFTDASGINNKLGYDGDCQCVITTTVDITTNTLGSNGKSQHGREVAIANGSNNITLTCEINSEADFIASYTKEGAGSITIVAGAGATLLKADGIDLIGGIPGSSFCIKRRGIQFQIFISNR